jgi:uncharacterized RDD family membrane protein YckC
MDRTLAVRTPESIAFSYELAGIGSRFLAVALDMLCQFAVLFAIFWGLILIATHAPHTPPPPRSDDRLSESIGVAIVVAVVFLIFFGYFIAFEAFWHGQTPGKKLVGLRVVRDGGYPIDLGASAIRNIIRIGEFAAGFYAVSAVAALCSRENKRLGDMAAGTIVVRDARAATLAAVRENAGTENAPRPVLLTKAEHDVIDRFASRRAALEPHVRAAIAARIAGQIRPRVSYDLQRLSDEELIEKLSAS